jgi:hypothetical protein
MRNAGLFRAGQPTVGPAWVVTLLERLRNLAGVRPFASRWRLLAASLASWPIHGRTVSAPRLALAFRGKRTARHGSC